MPLINPGLRKAALVTACLLCGFCLLAAGCGPEEPLRLGFLGGLTGRVADLGMAGRDGAQLAVDLRNQAGGLKGRRVVLLVKDDRQDPQVARRQARELVDLGVAAVIGPMTSTMAIAVVPLMNQARVVMVSPTATSDELSGKDDFFFRMIASTKHYATASARYQLNNKTMRLVAAAWDLRNKNYTENWVNHFEAALRRGGGSLVARVPFVSDSKTSFKALAGKLLAAKPDGILLAANMVDCAMLCQQIRMLDKTIPITSVEWAAHDRLIKLGGRAVEGLTVLQSFSRERNGPRFMEFRRLFKKHFGYEPETAGSSAFDAVNLVLDSLEKGGGPDSLKQAMLATGSYKSLNGDMSFNRFGDVQRSRLSMAVIKGGQFRTVE